MLGAIFRILLGVACGIAGFTLVAASLLAGIGFALAGGSVVLNAVGLQGK